MSKLSQTRQMQAYSPEFHEIALIRMIMRMHACGEFNQVFGSGLKTLTEILKYFKEKAVLCVDFEGEDIITAIWFEPILSGACWGIWVHPDHRTKETAKLVIDCLERALQIYPVVIGLCKQPLLKEVHERVGLEYKTTIPLLWDGEPVDVYVLTKESFKGYKEQCPVESQVPAQAPPLAP